MIRRALIAVLITCCPMMAGAQGRLLWHGGLWNLDYPGTNSTYGDFRLIIEPDIAHTGAQILRVEWMETIDGKGQRLYASRLIPELDSFVSAAPVKVEMSDLPNALKLQNAKGRVVWLKLREPTRYQVQRKPK